MLTANHKEVLAVISQGQKRFTEIEEHFKRVSLKIHKEGVTKILTKLKRDGYIKDLLSEGKKLYSLTDSGTGYLNT